MINMTLFLLCARLGAMAFKTLGEYVQNTRHIPWQELLNQMYILEVQYSIVLEEHRNFKCLVCFSKLCIRSLHIIFFIATIYNSDLSKADQSCFYIKRDIRILSFVGFVINIV